MNSRVRALASRLPHGGHAVSSGGRAKHRRPGKTPSVPCTTCLFPGPRAVAAEPVPVLPHPPADHLWRLLGERHFAPKTISCLLEGAERGRSKDALGNHEDIPVEMECCYRGPRLETIKFTFYGEESETATR